MFHHLLEPFAREFSGKRAWRMVSELWQFRNTVVSPGLTEASRYCVDRFREAGADTVRMVSYKADGKTKYGATTIPREWSSVRTSRFSENGRRCESSNWHKVPRHLDQPPLGRPEKPPETHHS